MRISAEVKVGEPLSAIHSSVLSLPIYPLTASRSVSGSTLLHVITQAADNRHFIRTRACRCSSCPRTGLTLCDRMLRYWRPFERNQEASSEPPAVASTLFLHCNIQTCPQLTGGGRCLPLLYTISKNTFLKLHWNVTHICAPPQSFFLYLYLIEPFSVFI